MNTQYRGKRSAAAAKRFHACLCAGAAMLLVLALTGCAPKSFVSDFGERSGKIKTIAILEPKIDVLEIHFGGATEKQDDWSEQAARNIVDAVTTQLSARGFAVKLIPREGKDQEAIEEISDLFSAIAWSYREHVVTERSTWAFPEKVASFEYSIGPLNDLLDANKADAAFLILGFGKRGGSASIQRGSVVYLALAERSGSLLWLGRFAKPASIYYKWDIAVPGDAAVIVSNLFLDMPKVTQ